ncbi:MAG: hypothetical protein IKK58_05035 [Clostridia bacterium]|nr:hypothetical protein [Clostridia bacterium]
MRNTFYKRLNNGAFRVDNREVATNVFAAADRVKSIATVVAVLLGLSGALLCFVCIRFGSYYNRAFLIIGTIVLTVISILIVLGIGAAVSGMLIGRAAMVENAGSGVSLLSANAKVLRDVQKEIGKIKIPDYKEVDDADSDDEDHIYTYIHNDYKPSGGGNHTRHKENLFYSK